MASQAAYRLEKAIGHDTNAIIPQDVSNYEATGEKGTTMKALAWQGKQKVEIGERYIVGLYNWLRHPF
jgi:hypothetical protein